MVILFDLFNLPDDIYQIVFATEQQQLVGRLLVSHLKNNGGEIGKTEMSMFAMKLHDGEVVIKGKGKSPIDQDTKISYNKRQFYDRILTPMRGMGLIEYDLYKKTYRLSDRFNKMMIKIGIKWLKELEKK
tara:strand:+ start:812 stop:1201 length:390 start_codon:yes stop_codon:yes gene_type:complete